MPKFITEPGFVEYKDHMGTDMSVVDAARVSFHKESTNYDDVSNEKLIHFLAKEHHELPFAHTSIQLRIKSSISIARQFGKHQVGFSWNEVSRRYVTDEPEFYIPAEWRGKPINKKQGSSKYEDENSIDWLTHNYKSAIKAAYDTYLDMIKLNVAPELARLVLPQSMMTEWIWTGSLLGYARVYKLRTGPDSQYESQYIAHKIGEVCEKLFPISWKVLTS